MTKIESLEIVKAALLEKRDAIETAHRALRKEATEEKKEIPKKFEKLVKEISELSVLELSELVSVLEDHFGVTFGLKGHTLELARFQFNIVINLTVEGNDPFFVGRKHGLIRRIFRIYD